MAWTDGQSTWLVDGFFSRQPLSEVAFTRLKVNETQVGAVAMEMFKRLNMPSVLSGILVAHSHYDHSMDAPFLAKQYGARVVGSESTLQIAKGQDLPNTQMEVVPGGGRVKLGEFDIQLIHAGYVEGQNKGVSVKHVFLGMGGLGKLSDAYIENYWQEMVGFPDYSVTPAGEREVYFPITLIEPFDERNQRAFGYDMFSEPTRREAMRRAMDTGQPTVSGLLSGRTWTARFESTPDFDQNVHNALPNLILLAGGVINVLLFLTIYAFVQQRKRESASKEKSQFLANMSHEIRTPLNAILGFNSLLGDQVRDPQSKEYVKQVREASEQLLGMVEDVLSFSQIE
eukprot:gene13847-13632_t